MRRIDTTQTRLAVLGRSYTWGPDGKMVGLPAWEAANVTRVTMPTRLPITGRGQLTRSTVRIHRLLAAQLRGVFADLVARNLWRYFHTFGGDFVVRPIRGSTAVSAHAFACAIDFNDGEMPRRSPKRWPAAVVAIWNAHGFINGAGFAIPDPMHFEARAVWP